MEAEEFGLEWEKNSYLLILIRRGLENNKKEVKE